MSDFNPPLPPYPPAPAIPTPGPGFPMTFGQILDRIFRLVRGNVRPFIWIGMFPIGIVIVLEAVLFGGLYLAGAFTRPPAHPDPAVIGWTLIPCFLVFIPVMFFMYGLYYGASSYAALQVEHGFKVTAGEAFRHGWSRIGRYTWLMVLRTLIVGLPILVLAVVIAIAATLIVLVQGKNTDTTAMLIFIPIGILLYFGFLVYAVIMSLRYSLAFPACVHEGLTAGRALKRSGVLTSGAKGRIFLILLVIYAIGYVFFMIMYAVGFFAAAIIAAVAGMSHLSHPSAFMIAMLVIAGLGVLALVLLWSALMMAGYSIAFAVFYRDQCLRKDGLMTSPTQ